MWVEVRTTDPHYIHLPQPSRFQLPCHFQTRISDIHLGGSVFITTSIKNEKEGKKESNRGRQHASCKYLLCKSGNQGMEGSDIHSGQVQDIPVTMIVSMHKARRRNSKQGWNKDSQPLGGGYNIFF